jgi:hypothetical protein
MSSTGFLVASVALAAAVTGRAILKDERVVVIGCRELGLGPPRIGCEATPPLQFKFALLLGHGAWNGISIGLVRPLVPEEPPDDRKKTGNCPEEKPTGH